MHRKRDQTNTGCRGRSTGDAVAGTCAKDNATFRTCERCVAHRGKNPTLSLDLTCRWGQFFNFRCLFVVSVRFQIVFWSECDFKLVCCGFRLRSSICMTDDSAHIMDDKTSLKNASTQQAGSFPQKADGTVRKARSSVCASVLSVRFKIGICAFQIGFRLVFSARDSRAKAFQRSSLRSQAVSSPGG